MSRTDRKTKKAEKAARKDASLFGLVASAALLPVLASRFRKARASRDRLEILDVAASAAVIATGAAKVLRKRRTAESGSHAAAGES